MGITHLKRGNNTLNTAFTLRHSFTSQDNSYDSAGNITSIFDLLSGETQSFGYDTLDRLTTASAVSGLANYTETYSYNVITGDLEGKGGSDLYL